MVNMISNFTVYHLAREMLNFVCSNININVKNLKNEAQIFDMILAHSIFCGKTPHINLRNDTSFFKTTHICVC